MPFPHQEGRAGMLSSTLAPHLLSDLAVLLGEPLVIVDVGAQTLESEAHVYAPLSHLGIPTRVIGFEPQAAAAQARRGLGDCEIIEAYVGDGAPAVFHANNSSGTSSLRPLNRAVCDGFVSLAGLRTCAMEAVATARLDDLLADLPAVDFLKLDIQGCELAALEGARATLARTALIQCEVEFAPIYAGQSLFSEVELFLRGQGFRFLDFHAPAWRAPVVPSGRVRNEQLLWADALFVAESDRAAPRALLAQAIIALGLYGKISVAERALAALDARTGTGLADMMAHL